MIRDDPAIRTGGCLCGAVRFEIRGALRAVTTCHCTMCRRAGTSVGAYTACAPDNLTMTGRAPAWYNSSPEARRGFCPVCGSQLFWEAVTGDHISVSAGAIDDQDVLVPGEHIYVDQSDRRSVPT